MNRSIMSNNELPLPFTNLILSPIPLPETLTTTHPEFLASQPTPLISSPTPISLVQHRLPLHSSDPLILPIISLATQPP